MSQYTTVVPLAGRSSRFPGTRLKWLLVAPDGELMLHKALRSVQGLGDQRIVLGVLREHDEQYGLQAGLKRAFPKGNVELVILAADTAGPADTVQQTVRQAGIDGPILIKDCDSWFELPKPSMPNIISVARLQDNLNITKVAAKSFVQVNSQMLVTSISEKIVCSDWISVGGYGFESAQLFCDCFDKTIGSVGGREVFVSHVILTAIDEGQPFLAVPVSNYVDAGTAKEWHAYRARQGTYFIDLDGLVFVNRGEFFGKLWDDEDVLVEQNVETLKALQAKGAQFIFASARPERYRAKVEATLKALGLSWHALILGCHHGRRYLLNDYAPTNPYPSAVAVNIKRDRDELADLLTDELNA